MRYTRSAKESSSCPIKLLFFLHRATLPSMKSKNNPKGMNANAAQRFACAEGGPRQYLIEEKIDITPQKPEVTINFGDRAALGLGEVPFNSVIRSAKWSILIIEKWVLSSVSSFFCLSIAARGQAQHFKALTRGTCLAHRRLPLSRSHLRQ
jgi:hypothetical protein